MITECSINITICRSISLRGNSIMCLMISNGRFLAFLYLKLFNDSKIKAMSNIECIYQALNHSNFDFKKWLELCVNFSELKIYTRSITTMNESNVSFQNLLL